MKQRWLHIGGWASGLLLALSGCAKDYAPDHDDPSFDQEGLSKKTTMAIGTFRIMEDARTVRIDESTLAYVTNPDRVSDLADGTRIFLEYAPVEKGFPDFCTEAVYVLWASVLDEGSASLICFEEQYNDPADYHSDPIDIVQDWMTSVEDGFLTLHYQIPASGDKKHAFKLYHSWLPGNIFYLVHDAQGDAGTELVEGIVYFRIGDLFPDENGKKTLTLNYYNLEKTLSTLTFDYRTSE